MNSNSDKDDKEAKRLASLANAYSKVADEYSEMVVVLKAKTKLFQTQIANLEND